MQHPFVILALFTVTVSLLLAHEGHAPLPSKRSDVDLPRGLIRLSGDAKAAQDVQITEIGTTPPPADSVLANAVSFLSGRGVPSRSVGYQVRSLPCTSGPAIGWKSAIFSRKCKARS